MIQLYVIYKRLRSKDPNRLKVKGWKKIYNANSNQKRACMAILIAEKIDLKSKKTSRDKKEYYKKKKKEHYIF